MTNRQTIIRYVAVFLKKRRNIFLSRVHRCSANQPTGNILWLHNALLYCVYLSMYDGALLAVQFVCLRTIYGFRYNYNNERNPAALQQHHQQQQQNQQSVVSARCHRRRGRRRRCVVAECKVWYVLCVCTICVYTHTSIRIYAPSGTQQRAAYRKWTQTIIKEWCKIFISLRC